tara:strand:+ start:130 stop:279 length:150 start_codon:yes stop_codon:yes gene_type:complete
MTTPNSGGLLMSESLPALPDKVKAIGESPGRRVKLVITAEKIEKHSKVR